MQVPIFRAKDADSGEYVEGFYVEYPVANSKKTDDFEVKCSLINHCIFVYKPSVLGIINEPYVCTIDIQTLEFVRFAEIPCKNAPVIIRP